MQAVARVLLCMAALQLLCVLPGQVNANPSQPQGHSNAMAMPELPLTENGRKYHACWIDLAEIVESSNTTFAAANRALNAALYGDRARQLAEKVVAQLPITFADNFCAEIHALGRQDSLQQMVSRARASAPQEAMRKAGLMPSTPAAGNPSTNGGQLTQASKPGNPVKAAEFSDYKTDPTSNLTLPHKAVYYNGHDTRSDDDEMFAALISCTTIEMGTLVTETICQITATVGSWEGVGLGSWQAPAEVPCIAGLTALQVGYSTCYNYLEFNNFYDDTINGAELEATYENVIKTMNNQVNLWDKVHYTHVLLSQQMARFESTMNDDFTVLTTQNCDLKTRLADLQREANYLRYLLTTPLDKRPSFSRSAGRCSFADPSYCSMPAQTPAQALSLLKTQLQETCSVTDGARDLDLTTKSASAGQ